MPRPGRLSPRRLSDPALRLRRGGLEVVASLGDHGVTFVEALRRRIEEEDDPAVREDVARLLSRLEALMVAETPPEADGD